MLTMQEEAYQRRSTRLPPESSTHGTARKHENAAAMSCRKGWERSSRMRPAGALLSTAVLHSDANYSIQGF